MEYKVDDEFLDKVDALLDSISDMCQSTDTLDNAGVAIINIQKWAAMRDKAAKVLDSMNDGFDAAEGEEEDEEKNEECTDPGDDDLAAIYTDPDGDGSGYVAY